MNEWIMGTWSMSNIHPCLFIIKQDVRWRPEYYLHVSQEKKQNKTLHLQYGSCRWRCVCGFKGKVPKSLWYPVLHMLINFFWKLLIKMRRNFRKKCFTRTDCHGLDGQMIVRTISVSFHTRHPWGWNGLWSRTEAKDWDLHQESVICFTHSKSTRKPRKPVSIP